MSLLYAVCEVLHLLLHLGSFTAERVLDMERGGEIIAAWKAQVCDNFVCQIAENVVLCSRLHMYLHIMHSTVVVAPNETPAKLYHFVFPFNTHIM